MSEHHDTVRILEARRFDIVADLAFTWPARTDLCEPVDFHLVIAASPSPTKDAISIGLLAGTLTPRGHGLCGDLELTALGRLVVRRFHHRMAGRA